MRSIPEPNKNEGSSPANLPATFIPPLPFEKMMAISNPCGKPLAVLDKNQFKDEVVIRNADSGKGNFTVYWHIRKYDNELDIESCSMCNSLL